MMNQPNKTLVTVPNPYPNRAYTVEMDSAEFTTLCPMTGQPDFATIYIEYEPAEKLVELKSLKLYLWSFRNEANYHEACVNQILDDFVAASEPRTAKVVGDFTIRGGIHTKVTAMYQK